MFAHRGGPSGRHPKRGSYLSLIEAARLTPMGPDWLSQEISRAAGPAHYLFAGRLFFIATDLEEWIETRRVEAGRGSRRCPTCKRPLQ